MQGDEGVAGERGQKTGQISASTEQGTTDLALQKGQGRGTGAGLRESQQRVVLLVRKKDQGTKSVGQHDETADVSGSRDRIREGSGSGQANPVLDITVRGLTAGETWLIWRRRKGWTQKETADILGYDHESYGEMERYALVHENVPNISELQDHEKCLIYRRRLKLTIQECADKFGISRYWFNRMELGKANSQTLVECWAGYEG